MVPMYGHQNRVIGQRAVSKLWTLCGPYASGRSGPPGNGPTPQINDLALPVTRQNARDPLEVAVRASLNEFDVCGRGGIGRRACLRCMYP